MLIRTRANPTLVFSEGIVGPGQAFFEAVCREGLEGFVAKRFVSCYWAWPAIRRLNQDQAERRQKAHLMKSLNSSGF